MRITFKFPALVFYVKQVTKTNHYVVRGKAIGPIIIIGKSYARDKGLLTHELTHVKEWWTHGLLIHNILYSYFRSYRLRSECKAYYEQWKEGDKTETRKQDYIDRIWLFYNLKYPREYIEKIFSKYLYKY